jgi:hypothetical protein
MYIYDEIQHWFERLSAVGHEVCFSLARIGGVAVAAPKPAGAERYRRVVFGKETVKILAGVAASGAPTAGEGAKKCQKVRKSAIRPVAGRHFIGAKWISVKKR